jgi:hypothetical protein
MVRTLQQDQLISSQIKNPIISSKEHCSNSIWEERLATFLKVEYCLKERQFIRSLCLSVFISSFAILAFTLTLSQVMPAWLFVTALISSATSILLLFIIIPFVKIAKINRNSLSRRFYKNDLYIEFNDESVSLINRRNGKIICKLNR